MIAAVYPRAVAKPKRRQGMRLLTVVCIAVAGIVTIAAKAAPRQIARVDAAAAKGLLEAYEQGQPPQARFADNKILLGSLDAAVPAWISAAPDGGRERRRHLAALMVLELTTLQRDEGAIGELVEWACALLRRGPASDFERDWMVASLAVHQPAPDQTVHTTHALSRFPADPRVQMAAISGRPEAFLTTSRPGADLSRLVRGVDSGLISPLSTRGAGEVPQTRAALEQLARDADVGAEAIVRLGLLLFHLNDLPGSIEWLSTGAERMTDPSSRHFAWLSAGLALDAAERRAEAVDAYRHATQAIPDALSSSMALAAALFLRDERRDAVAVLESALGRAPAVADPWCRAIFRRAQFALRVRNLRTMAALPLPPQPAPGPHRDPIAGATDPGTAPSPARPTFRAAAASGVLVDVSVFNGRNPVKGLSAADFEVLDDGVPQSVSGVSVEGAPLDVTVVVDIGQEFYAIGDGPLRRDAEAGIQDLREIPKLLRPTDRYRVITVGTAISELLPLQPLDGSPLHFGQVPQGGIDGALYDGVAAALIRPTPADRRHLVVIFTDGVDTTSVVTARRLREIALRSDPVLHLARRFIYDELIRQKGKESPAVARSLLWPPATTTIEEIVTAAGGDVRHAQSGESMVTDVRALLDRFRQRYLLQFQPTGVADSGWHKLSVSVKKSPRYQVRARRGYFAAK